MNAEQIEHRPILGTNTRRQPQNLDRHSWTKPTRVVGEDIAISDRTDAIVSSLPIATNAKEIGMLSNRKLIGLHGNDEPIQA